jgi:hypothetical protein
MTIRPEPLRLRGIISGGQSGVMRGALDAALELGIPHGGIAPGCRVMDDGVLPPRYALVASSDHNHYKLAVHNIRASDGTLIVSRTADIDHMSQYVKGRSSSHGKPHLVLYLDRIEPEQLIAWLCEYRIGILNVHGPREVKVQRIRDARNGNRNHQPGIGAETRTAITMLLTGHLEVIRANALAHSRAHRAESDVTPPGAIPAQTAPARPRDPEPHGPPSAPRS